MNKAETSDVTIKQIFPLGEKNETFAKYFIGQSYLAPLTLEGLPAFNVTFEPGCRNNWHKHLAKAGGGQLLLCTAGEGWFRREGKKPKRLTPGSVVFIPVDVKHLHGASKDSWFAHVALSVPAKDAKNEWLDPVTDEAFSKLG